MTPPEGRPMQPGAATEVIRFSGFTLDVSSGELKRNGTQTYLRPKAQAVLVPLARNKGRVISKDELMDTAWPGVFVTEDSLTQSIREVRESLGDTGQTLVRTISKRGYLLADETPLEEDNARFRWLSCCGFATRPVIIPRRCSSTAWPRTSSMVTPSFARRLCSPASRASTSGAKSRKIGPWRAHAPRSRNGCGWPRLAVVDRERSSGHPQRGVPATQGLAPL